MDATSQGIWHGTWTPRAHPALEGAHRTEVVVVGAGITGLTAAVLLASKGVDVVVVEALRVAAGVTGRTTAKVTSQHSLLYSTIASKHGEDVARVYATANQTAVEQVAALVDVGGIDCDLARRPAATYTREESFVSKVRHEAELCRRLSLPATFTTDSDLPYDILGAVRFDDQVQLQPVAYCDGLARLLVSAGGRIFEGSRVTDVQDGSPAVVTTEAGSVTADTVILATQIPLLDRGMFFAKLEPRASHGIAVETDGPVPEGMYITAESPSRSVRSFAADGRRYVLVVGEGHRTGESDEAEHERNLVDFAAQHWPDGRVTHRWMAEDFIPQDSLPSIGSLSRSSASIFVATGFQKWGLSNGTAAAMILADLVLGEEHPWADVFDPNRLTPSASAKAFVEHNVKAAAHMITDRVRAKGRDAVASLAPGDGVVVSDRGDRYAVCKDDAGEITTVSAVCTHLGCVVAFNRTDRTWDCPCHGSRFAADGTVLRGPAVVPLAGDELPGS